MPRSIYVTRWLQFPKNCISAYRSQIIITETLMAFRLIPLNKNPGVRPIGIEKVIRRIIGKEILKITGSDVQVADDPLKSCGGHESGADASIHATNEILEEDHVKGAFLVKQCHQCVYFSKQKSHTIYCAVTLSICCLLPLP